MGLGKANLNVNDLLKTVPNNLDATFFLTLVQGLELAFLLPVVYRANNNLTKTIK